MALRSKVAQLHAKHATHKGRKEIEMFYNKPKIKRPFQKIEIQTHNWSIK